MEDNKKLRNVVEALAMHESPDALEVLERIGTNCAVDDVRRLVDRTLVRKNTPEALKIVIEKKGKGINDLSTSVAMSTINELLSLEDKKAAVDVLSSVEESATDEEIRGTASSVKTLMQFA
jgi:hypothetical protein